MVCRDYSNQCNFIMYMTFACSRTQGEYDIAGYRRFNLLYTVDCRSREVLQYSGSELHDDVGMLSAQQPAWSGEVLFNDSFDTYVASMSVRRPPRFLCYSVRWRPALKILHDMEKQGPDPSLFTYSSAIDA